jgi:hypothetical protein
MESFLTLVNFESLRQRLPPLRKEWQDPSSYRTVVFDGLIYPSEQEELGRHFPDCSWKYWQLISNSLQLKKRSCDRIEVFPPPLAAVVHELYSSPVIRFLENLTEIEGLVPDPHLWGGGLHCMEGGGYLWPHTDFLQGQHPWLKRVINLVLYVHPHWTQEMGGHFERWERSELVQSILPTPGRCVIFRTDSHSIHAVSPINGDLVRQSIALFYYSVINKTDVSLDHTTGWRLNLKPSQASIPSGKLFYASLLMRCSQRLKQSAKYLNEKAERIVNSGQ